MGRRTRRGILALGVGLGVGLGWAPAGAKAQLFGGGAPPAPPSGGAALVGAAPATTGMSGMYGNPYMNPMMNPYTNPYMATQGPVTPGNTAMYFFAAQAMNGGIGSGKIGGPNARGPARGDAAAKPAAADAARPTGADTPGATASRYFNRNLPVNTGASRYYGRQGRYFPNNGR